MLLAIGERLDREGDVATITVESLGESQYRVIVVDGKQRSSYVVTATANDVQRYGPAETSPER